MAKTQGTLNSNSPQQQSATLNKHKIMISVTGLIHLLEFSIFSQEIKIVSGIGPFTKALAPDNLLKHLLHHSMLLNHARCIILNMQLEYSLIFHQQTLLPT